MPYWVYVLIAVIIVLACIVVVVLCCKYRDRIKKYWLAKRVGNGRKKAGSPTGNHDSAMEKSTGMDSAAQWGTLTLNEETVKPDKLQRLGKQTVNIDVLSA